MTTDVPRRMVFALMLALMTVSCGLKGDLYLPEEQAATQAPAPESDGAADEQSDDEAQDESAKSAD